MSAPAFAHLVELLERHPIFQRQPGPGRPPRPASHQIATFLLYVGAASSKLRAAIEATIGEGSVYNYTRHVVTALLDLKTKTIFMPGAVEKQELAESFGLPGCVGLIDGSLFLLASTPHKRIRTEYYSGRAKAYCVCPSPAL